ncbi:MAG: flagellar FliJ family protein [Fidelibacterota bacterium]|nr:MAG: flagellar FliJ family protein [Candidatus Neomarinimicrobiota bacterium]
MAKKGFQHHRLLDVKALILNLKSMALRKSEDQQRSKSARLQEIQGEKQAHLQSDSGFSSDDQDNGLSSRELQVQTWYTEQLNEDLRRQVHEVRVAEEEVRKKRKGVEKSAKEKKSLEKLKEHQNLEALRETEREEQKHLDEIAGRQRSRTGGSEGQ